MKKWGKAIALIGINLTLTAGLVEAALRLLPTLIPASLLINFEPRLRSKIAASRFPTADDAIAFNRTDGGFPFPIWKPFAKITYSFTDPGTVNTVNMDENGFCNAPAGLYSQHSQFDVIGIGDSFTWCTTVRPEDTWVAQLARDANVSAYSLGKPAISLYEYLQLLERYGLKKSPKVVVMNVYEGNDLRDALKYVSYRQSGETQQQIAEQEETVGPLGQYSYAWNLLRAVGHRDSPPNKSGSGGLVEGNAEDGENFRYALNFRSGSVPFNLENGDLDEVLYAKLLTNGKINLDVFSEAIAQFAALAQTKGFAPILAYTPSAYTAYADVVSFEQLALNEIMPAYSRAQRTYFVKQAAAVGLMFVDMTPILQSVAADYTTPEKLLYYQTNRHLTQYGHAVVSNALRDLVKQEISAQD